VVELRDIKVGIFSAQNRDLRVLGILIKHLKSTAFRFTLTDRMAEGGVDIAIIDQADTVMRELAEAAGLLRPGMGVIRLVANAEAQGAHNELVPSQMMSHLMPMLDRVAASVPAAAPPRPAATSNVVPLAPPQQARLRALVVDDSPTVRTQLANVIARIGMHCDAAASARAALEQLQAERYDLIFVDVVMPEMDGYKLTREIKRIPAHKATPVIILTSQSSTFDRARGALAGCEVFLTKPVGIKAFFDATTKALRRSVAVDDLAAWLQDPTLAPRSAAPLARAAGPEAATTPMRLDPLRQRNA
jgi:CheY-like chemotaxis protein